MSYAHEHEWQNGICSCTSDPANACLACWCPCIIYGKTSYRSQHLTTDPSLSGYSTCNGDCCAFAALAILTGIGSAILQCIRRPNLRQNLNISGSGAKDCLCVCCCNCCTLVQEERELRDMQEEKGVYSRVSQQPGMHESMAYQQTGQAPYAPQGAHAV